MRVEGNRLFEVFRAPGEPVYRPLVPKKAAFPVQFVCRGILAVPLDETSFLAATQLQRQSLGHLLRDPVLHREYVRRLLVELTNPECSPVSHPYQAGSYSYPISGSLNVPLQHRVDPQLATGGHRISSEPRVFAHRTGWSYHDAIDIAQIRDQSVGHAQLEVLVANLCAYRQEGKHGDRLHVPSRDGAHRPRFPQVESRSGSH